VLNFNGIHLISQSKERTNAKTSSTLKNMRSRIDDILNEIGLETPDLAPINKQEALEMGLIKGNEKPKVGVCGKSCYESAAHCDKAIKSRLKSGRGGTSFLRSYFCDECSAYHMTSSHNKLNK